MALRGEFPDSGLEARPLPLLKKSPRDVNVLLDNFTTAAERLEKRGRELDTDQLYELQQQLGLVVGKVQKGIYENLEKTRRR